MSSYVPAALVWTTKGTGGLQHHKFLIFDGKQHAKNTSVDVKITRLLYSVLKAPPIWTKCDCKLHLICVFFWQHSQHRSCH